MKTDQKFTCLCLLVFGFSLAMSLTPKAIGDEISAPNPVLKPIGKWALEIAGGLELGTVNNGASGNFDTASSVRAQGTSLQVKSRIWYNETTAISFVSGVRSVTPPGFSTDTNLVRTVIPALVGLRLYPPADVFRTKTVTPYMGLAGGAFLVGQNHFSNLAGFVGFKPEVGAEFFISPTIFGSVNAGYNIVQEVSGLEITAGFGFQFGS